MRRSHHTPRSLLFLTSTSLLVLALVSGGLARQDGSPTPTTSDGPATWQVDPVHSTALFRVTHLGAGAFWGRFNEPTGEISWDHTGEACPEFDVTIPISSVDSGNSKLDAHLRSMDFFNQPEFPDMTFKSTGCTPDGENRWDMSGDLTLLGQTKPVTVKLERIGTADMGRGMRSGFEATFTIKRSDHGMNWGVENGAVGDSIRVIVSLEVIRQ